MARPAQTSSFVSPPTAAFMSLASLLLRVLKSEEPGEEPSFPGGWFSFPRQMLLALPSVQLAQAPRGRRGVASCPLAARCTSSSALCVLLAGPRWARSPPRPVSSPWVWPVVPITMTPALFPKGKPESPWKQSWGLGLLPFLRELMSPGPGGRTSRRGRVTQTRYFVGDGASPHGIPEDLPIPPWSREALLRRRPFPYSGLCTQAPGCGTLWTGLKPSRTCGEVATAAEAGAGGGWAAWTCCVRAVPS